MMRGRAVALLEAGHICALSLWAGALAMTAATAAIAFPMMKSLDPALPTYASYPEDHGVIAAGHVMEHVFTVSDFAQLGLAVIAVALFIPLALRSSALGSSRRRGLFIFRAILLCALLISVVHYTFVFRSQMTNDLMAFWVHAANGEIEAADSARAAFDSAHPVASRRVAMHLAWVLCGIGLSVFFFATDRVSAAEGSARG